jgi:D-amino-acid oxidase
VTAPSLDALVVGAGVSGLTTGVCLAEAGLRVAIRAEQVPGATSLAAGAMWGPYLVEPRDRVRTWSLESLRVLSELAGDQGTGVRLVSGIEASRTPAEPPDWADLLPDFRLCRPEELPDGYATGWRFTVPLVDMPVYLEYLLFRFRLAGGRLEAGTVTRLGDLRGLAAVVVNCAGLGARELVADGELRPIRGQLVVVSNPGITEFFSEDTGLSPDLLHYYPHGPTAVLGGTAENDAWSMDPDPATARAIVDRCAGVEPRLRDARLLAHRIGLRPTRPEIRVEKDFRDDHVVIHNYGHGGAGVSVSWGCASAVETLFSQSGE